VTAPAYVASESVVRSLLATHFDGTARAVTELPANLETQVPLIEVERIGGVSSFPALLDWPRMDVWCYAAASGTPGVDGYLSARENARALAEQVRAFFLFQLPGQSAAGGFVSTVTEQQAPVWRPFDNTDVRRFQATYSFAIRSTP
jgi:hypothetical protein